MEKIKKFAILVFFCATFIIPSSRTAATTCCYECSYRAHKVVSGGGVWYVCPTWSGNDDCTLRSYPFCTPCSENCAQQ